MPIPELPKKQTTKVRWIKAINMHKVGQIRDVSTDRIKNLLAEGLVELYPPKPTPVAKPKPKETEEKEEEPVVETADARPALSTKAHKRKVHAK